MRKIRPLLLLFAFGCAPANSFQGPKTPEQDLRENLREGAKWETQNEMMDDVKQALGSPSNADASGPAKR
jgi:hypothetical protein